MATALPTTSCPPPAPCAWSSQRGTKDKRKEGRDSFKYIAATIGTVQAVNMIVQQVM